MEALVTKEMAALVADRAAFPRHAWRRLREGPVDFLEQRHVLRKERAEGKRVATSAVLVPLEFDPGPAEYAFVLNKRSDRVLQPGDLCCPGGGMDRRLDRMLARLLAWRLIPSARSEALRRVLRSPGQERAAFLYFFAGVLRESWEEMRLPPWKVEYMGALPTHRMPSFPRIIFPVVGRLRGAWKPRPNWEVERVLRLPLRSFFDPESYAICRMKLPESVGERLGADHWEVPCLVVEHPEGTEILWGATFRILMGFMGRVLDLPIARVNPDRRIERDLPENYFSRSARNR